MVQEYICDLHIHTCLSPCGDLDMYPSAIVEKCMDEQLDVIGICDHNASENVPHVIKAARRTPLSVLPGMEITTREEAHILALFDTIENLLDLQDIVYKALRGMNREEIFGCQPIVNENDEVEGFNDRLLIGATELTLHEAVQAIHDCDGIAIAAHIDRQSFGIIGQLGFIPPDVHLDALEVSHRMGLQQARQNFPELAGYALIESSDAHFISDIGKGTTHIALKEPTIQEFRMAFERRDGRYIRE